MSLSALFLAVFFAAVGVSPSRTSRPVHVLTDASSPPSFLVGWRPEETGRLAARHAVRSARAVAVVVDRGVTREEGVERAATLVELAYFPGPFERSLPSFFQLAGGLPAPVAGRVVARFGSRERSGSATSDRHSGLSFGADQDTVVRAVFRGLVVFSASVPGLGNVVVLDHGDDYHTVYAQMALALAGVGQIVEAGAEVGRGGALAANNRHEVYFELRDRGIPVNPSEWLR